jgi:uncharacterized Tic20 family protein
MDEKDEKAEEVTGGEEAASDESAATPASAEQPQQPQDVPKEARMWAMLCHLLGLFTCFIGPLIIWLVKKEENAFIDNQGKEALNFQITVAIAFVLAFVLTPVLMFICIGFALVPAVFIADLVFCILACVKSNSGEAYRYPVSLRLVK